MRKRTPTRDELVDGLGRGVVEGLESLRLAEGLDLLDRAFACAHGAAEEHAAHAEVGEAYLRARAKGTCPAFELSDFWWDHWDVDGLCGIFPCPHCAEENVHADLVESVATSADDRAREGDGDDHDETIPF